MFDAISKRTARLDPDVLELDTDPEDVYIPSREAIARECAEIRKSWSARERRKRSAERTLPPWMPPTIRLDPESHPFLSR